MSKSAELELTGKSRIQLIEELEAIKKWDNGHDHPINISLDGHIFTSDTIANVEEAVMTDLYSYVNENFDLGDMVIKTGGNDDIYIVPDPDKHNINGRHRKHRNKMTHLIPKKKKRKKK